MNRLSKILIAIIVILVIALIIISSEYVKMRKSAIKNLNLYFEAEARYVELKNGEENLKWISRAWIYLKGIACSCFIMNFYCKKTQIIFVDMDRLI